MTPLHKEFSMTHLHKEFNMIPLYDIVIPCAPKDYVKLPYCIKSLENLVPAPQNIYVVSRDEVRIKSPLCLVRWVEEFWAVPSVQISGINYRRPNWIYQQILKLTQDFTENDFYLCIDSDLIINRPIELFEQHDRFGYSIPRFLISSQKQNHRPYFEFMEKVFELTKQVDYSFISDIMMFHKAILKLIIPDRPGWLLEQCNQYLSDDCLISEWEIYGNWIYKNFREAYATYPIQVSMYGKYISNLYKSGPDLYTNVEIEEIINKEKNSSNDIVAIHSWS